MAKISGKSLARAYGIEVAHALYRAKGDWYHILRGFPGALFDANGYIFFETREKYDTFIENGDFAIVRQYLDSNTLTIKNGIKNQIAYIPFEDSDFLDEIGTPSKFWEGAIKRVTVNRYERDKVARLRCIEYWGSNCAVCGFDFLSRFGELGRGFIHVHHLTPISSIKSDYQLDAENDMRPVCPNCHAMLHRKFPPYNIEELKELLYRKA